VTEPLANTNRIQINTLALGARLPTMHGQKPYVEAGGLMSYGATLRPGVQPNCWSPSRNAGWRSLRLSRCLDLTHLQQADRTGDISHNR
jgi:hypothetical protein